MLQAVHDSIEEIPEAYRDLYTEKNGKFEVTGIQGVKTQGDIDRLQTALTKERAEHGETKDKLNVWADLDHTETLAKLDRIPDLEKAAEGKLDDQAIDEMVNRRVEQTINSRLAPIERDNKNLKKELENVSGERDTLASEKRTRTVHDAVRSALTKEKVIPEAHDDALLLADRTFEIQEDGAIVTKDSIGVTPGVTPDLWLKEMQERRPHWWPPSSGGGAGGGSGGAGSMADNPWTADNWNMTDQSRIVQTKGIDEANRLAKAAGTTVGGLRPQPQK